MPGPRQSEASSSISSRPQQGGWARPATIVTIRDEKIVSMRQFRSLEEALAAAGA